MSWHRHLQSYRLTYIDYSISPQMLSTADITEEVRLLCRRIDKVTTRRARPSFICPVYATLCTYIMVPQQLRLWTNLPTYIPTYIPTYLLPTCPLTSSFASSSSSSSFHSPYPTLPYLTHLIHLTLPSLAVPFYLCACGLLNVVTGSDKSTGRAH